MKKANNRIDAKDVVLPHSQAKLDLYKHYLKRYLRILGLADFCTKINLYDIYCGIGVYADGNIGSPLITNNCIKETFEETSRLGKSPKPISIVINDKEKDKIDNVRNILERGKIASCSYEYYNLDANEMLKIVAQKISQSSTTERNLIFIDPYGYSNILKENLYHLLKNNHTEIILFLPVNQMYRFTEPALASDRTCYDHLRTFINSFFPTNHIVYTDSIKSNLDFIYALKEALSFDNNYYTCSHYIERDKGNYYSLFFITAHIYGLEKMIEAKWDLDPIKGKGFNQKNSSIVGLFDNHFEEIDKKQHLDFLKTKYLEYLESNTSITNWELYELTNRYEFKVSHANSALKDLIRGRRIEHTIVNGQTPSHSDSFYIGYRYYRNRETKATFKLLK